MANFPPGLHTETVLNHAEMEQKPAHEPALHLNLEENHAMALLSNQNNAKSRNVHPRCPATILRQEVPSPAPRVRPLRKPTARESELCLLQTPAALSKSEVVEAVWMEAGDRYHSDAAYRVAETEQRTTKRLVR